MPAAHALWKGGLFWPNFLGPRARRAANFWRAVNPRIRQARTREAIKNRLEGYSGLCSSLSPYMPEPRRFRPTRNHRSTALDKQSFDPLESEAGVARTLVDFGPRRAHFA